MKLTETELRVVALLADGKEVEDIAKTLFMSKHTVRFHIRIAGAKCGGEGKPIVRLLRWYFNEKRAA